ncbi:hypothetical protein JKJ07_27625 [Actinoplanes sp. LDG1-01]|uniref:ATP-binding protein n=1 Tax=Paractinoplanes lichenicola TaxID=2802976 RepID=A0ABS1VUB6_9ACTN|nr:hypothetical protein [Actinoplanes lichenicola]
MFDRDTEWDEIVRFARVPRSGAALGVVSGRRRLGKSFMLDALVRASGGFMFSAPEAVEADALRQYGAALGTHLGEPTPLRFDNWDEAITRTMTLAPAGPLPVVIDEFPFLARASPALPSIIQRALDPAGQRSNTQVRLLLCGSALSFMGGLLSGTAPLRGRAGLELVVRTEAGPVVLGGYPVRVASGVVNDPAAHTQHEVDVAAFGRDEQGREELLAIGEAKWNETVGVSHLQRLERICALLRSRDGIHSDRCRLLLFSGAGFTSELLATAQSDPSIQLVDLDRLYAPS